ncbi:MAG: hypothetical protein JO221_03005 [Sphingomonas sp.]|nr:hypothetical protein [Sphingomonas sp.]
MTAGILAQLIAQGSAGGTDLATLRAIAEEAGELAATRALTRLGLADEEAMRDVAELRALLAAWRDAKRSAWKAAAGWLAALLLTAIAVKFGFGQWVK